MSVHSEIKKVTTETLRKMKFDKEKITMLTAYDYTTAKMLDAGGVDAILIGDSAANVMAGHETTLPNFLSFSWFKIFKFLPSTSM